MPRLQQQSIAILTACVVAAALQPLLAQQSPPDPVQQVASFITPQTIAVGRLDLHKLDAAALKPVIEKIVAEIGDADAAQHGEEAVQGIATFKSMLLDSGAAGQVYMMLGLRPGSGPAPHMVLPLKQGAAADAEAMARINKLLGMPHGRVIRGALVAAESEQVLDELAAPAPGHAPRPGFAAAVEAVEPAVINVWVVPNDDHRRVLEEMMPQLPPEAGGGPVTVLTRGVQWAGASIQGPPTKSMVLRVQSADADAAAAFKQFVLANLRRPAVADPAQRTPAAALGLKQMLENLADVLDIQQQDSQLVVQLDDQQVEQVVKQVLAPSLRNARQAARQAVSMNHLKQLAVAVHMHADVNRSLPNTLEELKPYLDGEAGWKRVMTHPTTGRFPGYRYARPGKTFRDVPGGTSNHPMIVETFDQWPGRLTFAFADGHVEVVSDRARARELLKQMELELKE